MAAARKVSPAASMTLRPSRVSRAASFPMVVVLPEPLTPATRMTNGFAAGSIASGTATGVNIFSSSVARIALTSSALTVLS